MLSPVHDLIYTVPVCVLKNDWHQGKEMFRGAEAIFSRKGIPGYCYRLLFKQPFLISVCNELYNQKHTCPPL